MGKTYYIFMRLTFSFLFLDLNEDVDSEILIITGKVFDITGPQYLSQSRLLYNINRRN